MVSMSSLVIRMCGVSARDLNVFMYYNTHHGFVYRLWQSQSETWMSSCTTTHTMGLSTDCSSLSQRPERLHVLQHTPRVCLQTVAVSARDLNVFMYYNTHHGFVYRLWQSQPEIWMSSCTTTHTTGLSTDCGSLSQRFECLHVLQHTPRVCLQTVAVSVRDLNVFMYYNTHHGFVYRL